MRLLPLLALLILLPPARASASTALGLPVRHAGESGIAAPYYVGEKLEVRLRPAAAQRARATVAAAGARGRLERLGVESVDRVAGALGAWFEPEFVGERAPVEGSGEIDFTAFYVVHLGAGVELEEALGRWRAVAEVASADPIAVVPVTVMPNDSLWGISTWLYQGTRRDIHAPEAWEVTTGDSAVVVAVLDTGVLPYHPDLGGTVAGEAGQMWVNWAEVGGTAGVDDDGNGFVDDARGWDFVSLADSAGVTVGEDWRDADNDPNDFAGHGTAVAGLVGAIANNGIGIAGVSWHGRIMPVRVGWSSRAAPLGEVQMSYAAQAMRYATRMGASVINCSFASVNFGGIDAAAEAAYQSGVTIVTAAGNNGSIHYLAGRDESIAVAAVNRYDEVSRFSNTGAFVDLAAPGEGLASTVLKRPGTDSLGMRQPAYGAGIAGTSVAAPLVSGAAALLQAYRRALHLRPLLPVEVNLRLAETADDISAANPSTTGYGAGRLNLARALLDPPGSYAIPIRGNTVGSAVIVPGPDGRDRVVVAADTRKLLFLDGASDDTIMVASLPGLPQGEPAAADLGGGRGVGIFVGTWDSDGKTVWVCGFDVTGAPLPGWPVAVGVAGTIGTGVALGDVDGNGVLEVVCAISDGHVYAWDPDGISLGNFPVVLAGDSPSGPPALSDLDGRSGVEIIVSSSSGRVTAIRSDGSQAPGWPVNVGTPVTAPVVGAIAEPGSPSVVVWGGGSLRAFTSGASPLANWSLTPFTPMDQDPALADGNGDGRDEIFAATGPTLYRLDAANPAAPVWSATFANYVDAPVLIGHLGGGSQSALVRAGQSLTVVDADLGRAVALQKPGRAGRSSTLAALAGDGATRIIAGSGAAPAICVYAASPGSWKSAPQAWATARGNFARTGSSLYAPPMRMVADTVHAGVVDLAVDGASAHSVALVWTAPPTDPDVGRAVSYELRHSTTPIDLASFSRATLALGVPVPDLPGARQSFLVTNLAEGATHYFALRFYHRDGRVSLLSNVATGRTQQIPPGAVRDLTAPIVTTRSVQLLWTAPGGDGLLGRADHYDLRRARFPLDSVRFALGTPVARVPAPANPGTRQGVVVDSLAEADSVYFALKAVDEAGLVGPVSNLAGARTLSVPPGAITDLQIARTPDCVLELRWTAPVDEGPTGRASRYEIGRATAPLDEAGFARASRLADPPLPAAAGQTQRYRLALVAGDSVHYFAIRSFDDAGNASRISNPARVDGATLHPAAVRDLTVERATREGIKIVWTTPPPESATAAASWRVLRARFPIRRENVALADSMAGGDAPPPDSACAATLPAIADGDTVYFAVLQRDLCGTSSDPSNGVGVTSGPFGPARVGDLTAFAPVDTAVWLRWTATGEDGLAGHPERYLARASEQPLDEATFASAAVRHEWRPSVDGGTREERCFAGLEPGRAYWIALRAVDHAGNVSALSNVARVQTSPGGRLVGRTGVAVAPRWQPSGLPVEIYWQGSAEVTWHIRIFDVGGRQMRDLPCTAGAWAGVVKWDGRNEHGGLVPAGLYFARLIGGSVHAQTRVVLLP